MANDLILAVDIGNTNIVLGLYESDKILHKWRINTEIEKPADDYAVDIVELMLTNKIDCLKINGAIISSVVPAINGTILEAIKKFLRKEVYDKILIVGKKNVDLGIEIKLANKNEVGHDRLINSIAAFRKFGGNLVIIDFGTATTFDIVGQNGEYLGGIIAPGINLSLKTLHDMTAQLPKISIKPQSNVIGKSTVEAMNSGVYFGYISMIEGMVKRIEKELGSKTTCIITGGLANIFKEPLKEIVHHCEDDLTLNGLITVFHRNTK